MQEYIYKNFTVWIEQSAYADARIKLDMKYFNVETELNTILLTCTLDVIGDDTEDGHVVVKDFFECEGIFDFLRSNRIIDEPIRYIETGLSQLPVCKFLSIP